MIGLGSNRLTVCRRGGMSVTQAGRGGMEWLAGGRMPRWASPYSAQATAALKAQFPTQWPTIWDYGFAHPEIVGYMNAYATEDAKIAYSLVEGIGTRWLVGDGNSYINTGFICDVNTILDIRFRFDEYHRSRNDMFGTFISTTNGFCVWSEPRANQSVNVNSPTINYTNYIWTLGETIDVYVEGRKAIVNGRTNTLGSTFNNSAYPAYIFTMNSSGNTTGNLIKAAISKLILTKNGEGRQMYPFIRKINGVDTCGMIDVLSGTFYPNAGSGSFTISETPAS